MMRVSGVTLVVAACLMMTTAGVVAAEKGPQRRGSLAIELVRAAGIPATDDNATSAAETLRRFGIRMGADLERPVIESDLVAIGAAIGSEVTTNSPERVVNESKGRAFARTISGQLQMRWAEMGASGEIRVSCQGRNSRAGRRGTPASPANPNATAPACGGEPIP